MKSSTRLMKQTLLAALLLSSYGILAAQAQIGIMALGDSITAGGGVGNDGTDASGYFLQSGYRSELYTDLTADKLNFEMEGTTTYHETAVLAAAGQAANNGFGGFTLGDIYTNLAGIDNAGSGGNTGYWMTGGVQGGAAVDPNIVLLMGGTNDLDQGISASTMETSMNNILSWFKTNRPGATVMVSTVLPFLTTNGYLSASATTTANATAVTYNNWLKNTELPLYSDTQLVDMNALFTANESTYFSTDGAHPNATGYNAMGDAWAAAIKTDAAPEPGSFGLLLMGLAPVIWLYRRSQQVLRS